MPKIKREYTDGQHPRQAGAGGPASDLRPYEPSAVRRELDRLREQFEAAEVQRQAALRLGNWGAFEAAVDRARAAAGFYDAAGDGLGELGLLLIRYAVLYRPEEVLTLLTEVLRDWHVKETTDAIEAVGSDLFARKGDGSGRRKGRRNGR